MKCSSACENTFTISLLYSLIVKFVLSYCPMIESFATTSKRKESVIGQSILRTFLLVCIECTYIRDRHLVIDDSIYMTVRYYVFTSFYLNIISYLRFRHQRVFHLNDVTFRDSQYKQFQSAFILR